MNISNGASGASLASAFSSVPSYSPVANKSAMSVSPVQNGGGIGYSSDMAPPPVATSANQLPPTSVQVPILRPALSGAPGEMMVIQPKPGQTPEEAAREGQLQAASREKVAADSDGCQTCEGRTYQDGSNDAGVSFKTPTQVDPQSAASMVRSHEQEHVSRNQVKAQREQREIISQSVQIHNAICAECGRIYVSGGTTRTTSRSQAAKQYASPSEPQSGQQLSKSA